MKIDRRLLFSFDWILLALILLISLVGLLNIYSAGYSLDNFRQEHLYLKQAQWIVIGLVLMGVITCFDYRFICRYAYVIYAASLFLLALVSLYGYATHGSQRWIILGGFFFQPSELVKLTIIIALAKYFDDHIIGRSYRLRELYIPFFIVVIPFFFILKQPDLGTALILMFLILSITFFIGIEWKSLLLACTGGLILIPLSWLFLKDYQKDRIMAFFNPENDPLGSGYHILQSIIAVGSGGIFGKGYLRGSQTQLKFLPVQQTDFVFSVFAEEWGFIGGVILVAMFLILILWCLKIALHSRDLLGMLISFGITMLVFWEVFINVGMVLGMLPVVGIPLPFLSYGGSSMVVLMTAMGLLLSVSMRRFILYP
ncbi:MAG: rod shape-determining protein RodA [Syntrophales bacterium]